jgi:hypothetical protein
MNLIHHVLLYELVNTPDSPRPLCRTWRDGSDWSTKTNAVTCPRCRRLLKGNASMEHREAGAKGSAIS